MASLPYLSAMAVATFFHATLNVFYSGMQVSKKFVLCPRKVLDALTLLVKLNKHSLLPR
jgi:hypothetical protein